MLTKKQVTYVKQMCEQSAYSLKDPISNIESNDSRIKRMVVGLLELSFDTIDT